MIETPTSESINKKDPVSAFAAPGQKTKVSK